MPIDATKLRPGEAIYTFVANDGTNTNIHIGRLRGLLLSNHHEIVMTPVNKSLADSFLAQNCISLERVMELKSRYASQSAPRVDPIILCRWEGPEHDVLLADGHHRYFLAAQEKRQFIHTWIVEPWMWRQFEVVNVPSITKDQLVAFPVTKRKY